MKYINKARVLLEYDKVLSQIASMARTEGAAELILKTEPTDDIVVVKRLLAQTAKAKEMIVKNRIRHSGSAKILYLRLTGLQREQYLLLRSFLKPLLSSAPFLLYADIPHRRMILAHLNRFSVR